MACHEAVKDKVLREGGKKQVILWLRLTTKSSLRIKRNQLLAVRRKIRSRLIPVVSRRLHTEDQLLIRNVLAQYITIIYHHVATRLSTRIVLCARIPVLFVPIPPKYTFKSPRGYLTSHFPFFQIQRLAHQQSSNGFDDLCGSAIACGRKHHGSI